MEFKRASVVTAASAFVIALVIALLSHTGRARLNAMQFVAFVFWAITITKIIFKGRAHHSATATASIRLPFLGIAIAVAAWIPMLDCGFISDDFAHLYAAAQGSAARQLWTLFREGQAGTFLRPLGFASIFLDYALWGARPSGYHVTNLALHFASVGALYLLARSLGISRDVAAVTSGIFAAMPAQVEAVAWMGARFDLLATGLTLWSAVFYLSFKKTRKPLAYAAVLAFYALAMLSKESAFILPVLLAVMEVFVVGAVAYRALGGVFAVGALVFVYRWHALSGIGGYSSSGIASALNIGPKTFEGLLLRGPAQLIFGLNWEQPPDFIVIGIASLTAGVLLMLVLGASPSQKSRSIIALGIAWAFIAMAPAHFLLMIGSGLTNSRVLYLAGPGAALVLGQLIAGLPERFLRQAAFLVLSLLFSFGVVHNIRAWRWTAKLSEDTLAEITRLAPAPLPQTEFVIQDLPDTIRGVFLFHVALTEGLRLAYHRDDISARRESEPPVSQISHPELRLVWEQSSNSLIPPPSR